LTDIEYYEKVLNSFVEPISYRTLSVILLLLLGFTLVSNLAFHFAKKKSPHPFVYSYEQVDRGNSYHMATSRPPQSSFRGTVISEEEEEEDENCHPHWRKND
jgi:hypothetical protein